MLKITFKYKDEWSHGEWNEQSCIVSSVEECKKIYGLGVDCEYEITSIEGGGYSYENEVNETY